MKPILTTNTKPDMSESDMTPLQIFSGEKSKGVSMKQVVIAVSGVLALAIIVVGFTAGFYLMKRTSDQQSADMAKVFQMKVNYGFKVSDEVVKTNVKEGTTELDTKDEKGKDVIMYNDFNKGLTVLVSGGDHLLCFVSPLNRSLFRDPATLQKYMESHPHPEAKPVNDNIKMMAAPRPISDSSFLGSKINRMCEGRDIYWMYPKQDLQANSRQKRERCTLNCNKKCLLFICWVVCSCD